MSERPSDGMELDELRDEFDWMFEFGSRMAERIRGDADVHNLVGYVDKLESGNAKLRELVRDMWALLDDMCEAGGECGAFDRRAFDIETGVNAPCRQTDLLKRMRELGIEVDG